MAALRISFLPLGRILSVGAVSSPKRNGESSALELEPYLSRFN